MNYSRYDKSRFIPQKIVFTEKQRLRINEVIRLTDEYWDKIKLKRNEKI